MSPITGIVAPRKCSVLHRSKDRSYKLIDKVLPGTKVRPVGRLGCCIQSARLARALPPRDPAGCVGTRRRDDDHTERWPANHQRRKRPSVIGASVARATRYAIKAMD
jgi:hypothetical protein